MGVKRILARPDMRPLTAQTPAKQAASSTAMVNSVTSNVDWTFESVGDHEIQTCSRSLACVFFFNFVR